MINKLLNKLFKPSWSKAPEWANYLAVYRGYWVWFDLKPLPSPQLNYWWGYGRVEETKRKFFGTASMGIIGNLEERAKI